MLSTSQRPVGVLDPRYGIHYLLTHGIHGTIKKGELYSCAPPEPRRSTRIWASSTRPGHSSRMVWFRSADVPVLSYSGQIALVVDGVVTPGDNPFFALSLVHLRLPLVMLSTIATVIASQSIISGVFSMTRQAIQIGLCPRLNVTQTSAEGHGQIYFGGVNWMLMVFTVVLAVSFGSSDNLAAAFGIYVSLTMLLTTVLLFLAMREVLDAAAAERRPRRIAAGGGPVVRRREPDEAVGRRLGHMVAAGTIFFLMSDMAKGRAVLLHKLERDPSCWPASWRRCRRPNACRTAVYLSRASGHRSSPDAEQP